MPLKVHRLLSVFAYCLSAIVILNRLQLKKLDLKSNSFKKISLFINSIISKFKHILQPNVNLLHLTKIKL